MQRSNMINTIQILPCPLYFFSSFYTLSNYGKGEEKANDKWNKIRITNHGSYNNWGNAASARQYLKIVCTFQHIKTPNWIYYNIYIYIVEDVV